MVARIPNFFVFLDINDLYTILDVFGYFYRYKNNMSVESTGVMTCWGKKYSNEDSLGVKKYSFEDWSESEKNLNEKLWQINETQGIKHLGSIDSLIRKIL